MKEIIEIIAKALVDDPKQVVVEESVGDNGEITLQLHVAPDDMGKVIGRQGRVAQAMRTVLKAAAVKENKRVALEIV